MAMTICLIIFAFTCAGVQAARDPGGAPVVGQEKTLSPKIDINPTAVQFEDEEKVRKCRTGVERPPLRPSPKVDPDVAEEHMRIRTLLLDEQEEGAEGSLLEVNATGPLAGLCVAARTWLQDDFLAQGAHARVYKAWNPTEWKDKAEGGENRYGRYVIKVAKTPADEREINAEAGIMAKANTCVLASTGERSVMKVVETMPCKIDKGSVDFRSLHDAVVKSKKQGTRQSGSYASDRKSGDIFHKFLSCTRPALPCGLRIFQQVFDALQCFHNTARYIHGDVKADNIMVSGVKDFDFRGKNGVIESEECPYGLQLADFGLSLPIGAPIGQYSLDQFPGCNHMPQGLFRGMPVTWKEVDKAIDYCSLLEMAHSDLDLEEPGIYIGHNKMFDGTVCGAMGYGRGVHGGQVHGGWVPAGPTKMHLVTHWANDNPPAPPAECGYRVGETVRYFSSTYRTLKTCVIDRVVADQVWLNCDEITSGWIACNDERINVGAKRLIELSRLARGGY